MAYPYVELSLFLPPLHETASADRRKHRQDTIKDPLGNNTIKNPIYRALSEFDYASFNLALYQEWIELDLFNYGLKRFSDAEWEEAGVTADYRSIIQYMANQETGHAQLVSNVSAYA